MAGRGKTVFAVGALGAGAYVLFTTYNPFSTPATKEIENRMTSAGGRPNSTPGAATPLGNEKNVKPAQENHSGPDTHRFSLNEGKYRTDKSGQISKKWNEVQSGNEQGK